MAEARLDKGPQPALLAGTAAIEVDDEADDREPTMTRPCADRIGGFCRGLALALGATAAIGATGGLESVERALIEQRFGLLSAPISDRVVLVEIDRASLDEVGVWPWPRSLNALALDRLGAAGAAQFPFDVDFSARSTRADDAALECALARSDFPALLAVFTDASADGAALDMGPVDGLLAHAKPVAVDMRAASDGRLWTAEASRSWRGASTPALFAATGSGCSI
jgi:CHASE2 domain-containing sensor protein